MTRRNVISNHPDSYKKLVATFKQAVSSEPTLKMAKEQGMEPFIDYWTPEQCDAYVKEFGRVWEKYKGLMK